MEFVKIIDDNNDALLWRLRMIRGAKRKLVMFTYKLRADNSGTDVIAALVDAAKRGVEEYILIDAISSEFHCDASDEIRLLSSFSNVHFYLYNPLPANPLRITFRLHDKILAIDDMVYMAGGRNVLDVSIGNYKDTYNIDRDVVVYPGVDTTEHSIDKINTYIESMLKEKVVKAYHKKSRNEMIFKTEESLTIRFEELCESFPFVKRALKNIEDDGFLPAEEVHLISGDPGCHFKKLEIWSRLIHVMKEGDDVLVQTPYIMCNESMYAGLREVIESDNSFSIITNAPESGGNFFGNADFMNQKQRIHKKGIKVYECCEEQSLHTKSILIDDDISLIGSFNFDMRSAYMDTEIMLLIRSKQVNACMRTVASELIKKSRTEDSYGRITYGENYEGQQFSVRQVIFYSILRVLVRPFRFLL